MCQGTSEVWLPSIRWLEVRLMFAFVLGIMGFVFLIIMGVGLLGTILLVCGAVAFMESGSILGLGLAIVGLGLICAVD